MSATELKGTVTSAMCTAGGKAAGASDAVRGHVMMWGAPYPLGMTVSGRKMSRVKRKTSTKKTNMAVVMPSYCGPRYLRHLARLSQTSPKSCRHRMMKPLHVMT